MQRLDEIRREKEKKARENRSKEEKLAARRKELAQLQRMIQSAPGRAGEFADAFGEKFTEVVTIPEYVPQVDELVGIRNLIIQLGSNAPALRSLMNKLPTRKGVTRSRRKGVNDALDVAIMKTVQHKG